MKRKEQLKVLAANCGTTSQCPYCNYELEKVPKRKVKCKSCKKPIYPRKEPLSGDQRLYREGDLFLLEELKALADGWWHDWYEANKGVLNARKNLAKEWNVDEVNVSIADARWRESHTNLAEATKKQDWDLVYSAYESMLRQVQREKSQDKTPLEELVAGLLVTGYGSDRSINGYLLAHRIGRPQYMLIDQLTTEPSEVYELVKGTNTAKTYCTLLNVSLDTVINRYKDELKEDDEIRDSLEQKGTPSSATNIASTLNVVETTPKESKRNNAASKLPILLLILAVVIVILMNT
ncbi:hypothetical protein [Vibrio parahaemolyticus]|uniref:hypothetical protein n=1 Tax=Vibrio parahaemolyticus TaxID=670 RepID=UPI0015B7F59B|nr:hypothetical protein [Vibrio parahaemolyticus]EHC7286921.1 hypothetical protein [Vibrio parahaemolyticus]EJE4145821.1 hypothetical protein [Vibrio parahaemolyticus]ELU0548162.1 hypothetical protein [Vibrio parahaemolyticus]QLE33907.1 hypothetical protein FDV78_25715 [Vibrio parahaemolyticus]HAV1551907.1 hypothetical protein [Vibrio parahaemolyticus]